mmetsp:Transcript_54760/g.125161  ORF Transcript_54760/g.125161 Transcript_54760/m.125161 type:complete len:236 (+) Transcript_54760:165-872(+)
MRLSEEASLRAFGRLRRPWGVVSGPHSLCTRVKSARNGSKNGRHGTSCWAWVAARSAERSWSLEQICERCANSVTVDADCSAAKLDLVSMRTGLDVSPPHTLIIVAKLCSWWQWSATERKKAIRATRAFASGSDTTADATHPERRLEVATRRPRAEEAGILCSNPGAKEEASDDARRRLHAINSAYGTAKKSLDSMRVSCLATSEDANCRRWNARRAFVSGRASSAKEASKVGAD